MPIYCMTVLNILTMKPLLLHLYQNLLFLLSTQINMGNLFIICLLNGNQSFSMLANVQIHSECITESQ